MKQSIVIIEVENNKATPALAQGVAFIASCMTLNPPEGMGFVGRRASMHGYDVLCVEY